VIPHRRKAHLRRFVPILIAIYVVGAFGYIAPRILEPSGPDLAAVPEGKLTDAQSKTLDTIKDFNSFLISMTTFMFAGLGWYLSAYRPTYSLAVRTVFFATVGFLSLAFWYAARSYVQTTSELAQNALGLSPGASRVLYYIELEFAACAIAGALILLVFADAVTRGRGRPVEIENVDDRD